MNAAPCRFFQSPKGCFRGDSCSFSHVRTDQEQNTTVNQSNGYEPRTMRVCKFYTSGAGCRNGTSCPFAHLLQSGVDERDMGGYMYQEQMGMTGNMDPPLPPSPPQPEKKDGSDSGGLETRTVGNRIKIQANPQLKKSNYAVMNEIVPVYTRDIEGPFYAIDVECVATGTGNDDRDVARIAIVDENENVIFDRFVMPDKPIVSYLTQLTGITEENLQGAPSLSEALAQLKKILPTDSVIVGQSIKKDLDWLLMKKHKDYKQMFDVADLFRIPLQAKNGTMRYRYFSLRHVAKYLLGHDIQEADHDPVIDAKYAMKVFNQFRHLHETPARREAVFQTLLKTPRTPSFADRYPEIDGVSMRPLQKPKDRSGRRHRMNKKANESRQQVQERV